MNFYVTVNKKYQYVRVYEILKKINESTNPLAKAFSSFLEKTLTKKEKAK